MGEKKIDNFVDERYRDMVFVLTCLGDVWEADSWLITHKLTHITQCSLWLSPMHAHFLTPESIFRFIYLFICLSTYLLAYSFSYLFSYLVSY